MEHPFLDLANLEKLRHVRLQPRGRVEGTYAGPHTSQYRGTSVEFSDYRDYVDGDDIRLLDWKVYARSDRHYVRLYESERNLLSYVVIDTSGSMAYTGTVQQTYSKLEYACRLAAALGYAIIREGDEVGLSLAAENVHQHLAPGRSWPHLANILDILSNTRAEGKTDAGRCLETVFSRVKRRGTLLFFTDFLDEQQRLWQALNIFRRSHFDVLLFQIVHPEEIELPAVPSARFIDPEDTRQRFVTEPALIRQLYIERFSAFLTEIEGHAHALGCDWYLARTDEDPYQFLERSFLR